MKKTIAILSLAIGQLAYATQSYTIPQVIKPFFTSDDSNARKMELVFTYPSCKKFNFQIETLESQRGIEVEIRIPRNQAECRAMPRYREYRYQIGNGPEDRYKAHYLSNPIGIEYPHIRYEY